MSEPTPPTPELYSPAEPAFAATEEITFDELVGDAGANTDDAPTIISKAAPTQSYNPFPAAESPVSGSIRGRTLAHFELLEPIGVGGMAAVLRARDKQLDRFVALKILPPEMAVDPEHVQRFQHEARAAAKLDHENIARVYYCGEDQKLHFIAFEFVEGQNLRTVLERQGRLPVKDAVHYLLQIATGLAHAASRGVVHRDIKPSNIIITPTGRAKLVDMGLARSQEATNDKHQLTQSGVTLGTFDYISPEQALEPRDADVRSDIYSLGCTFYHMLTGQPPVPEGTAAKKLHHHQRVAPIDPRQLNAEIPDDVAAILHRMMAKDAKDRYQRAEHLIQHLIQVAQKLGGADVPDGVFFVDAPLPNPPRKHPLLLAGLAVAALAIFVLTVALTTPKSPPAPPLRFKAPVAVQPKDELSGKTPGPIAAKELPVTAVGVEVRKVADDTELAEALAEERVAKILLTQDIYVSGPGLAYRSKRAIEIESDNPKKPAMLRFTFVPDAESPTLPWAGLAVESGSVTFRHVHFDIKSSYTPQHLAAGVAVKWGQAVFERCTFSQQTPPEKLLDGRNVVPIASVALISSTAQRPPLVFRHCYFPNGQAAVSIKGGGRVEQFDCAFGPHNSLFHLWGQKDDKAELFLSQISAHVAQGPVFRVDDNVQCLLGVQYSIFACPSNANSLDRPDFIRQTGTTRGIVYEGKRNAFHQLMSYWTRPAKDKEEVETTADFTAFRDRLKSLGGKDVGSAHLKMSPWAKSYAGPDDDPKAAFVIDAKLPELRQEDKQRPLGVTVCTWGDVYPSPGLIALEAPLPGGATVKLGAHERLVDPSGTATGPRVHKKLEAAISEAEPDDIILIKHNGELKVEPTALTENRHVKIRPFADYQPILVLGKTTEKTAALFHVHHSHIEFEQMEIVLRADARHNTLSVVSMGGDSVCSFDKCVLTLDNADNPGADIDVVTLLDPREMMKVPVVESRPRADLRFRNCFIRGRGDLASIRASRLFDLDVDATVVCLAGSLLTIHPQGTEAMSVENRSNVRLRDSTTYLAEPVLYLASAEKGKGLIFTQVSASNCFFGMSAAKPLVRLQGPENEKQLKKLLGWSGGTNAFVGFEKLLEQTGTDSGPPVVYQSEDWKLFSEADANTRFDRGLVPLSGVTERDFTQYMPSDFGLKGDWSNFGANVNAVPRPTAEPSGS